MTSTSTSTSTKGAEEEMAEEEMDESLLDEVDDNMSIGSNANAVTGENSVREMPATTVPAAPTTTESAGERSGSVASLSQRFMANVTVGSNDVFTAPTNHANTTIPPRSRKAAEKQDLRGGGLPREYEMVRAARRNWLAVSPLSGIGPLSRSVLKSSGFSSGSLVIAGDSRHLAVQHFHSLKDKLNISMSFDPKAMVCVTCPDKHTVLSDSSKPVCVVLSDHNFSPFVPANRGESCMLVIRAEDGLLGELDGIFRDVFKDFMRPIGSLLQGSVVLLGSLSHLSLLGLSTYLEDLVRSCNMLIGLTGPGVTICPTVSVPLAGISEVKTITELANLDSWLTSNKMAPNVCLPVSRNFLWDTLTSSASNFVELGPQGEILYLPISLTNSRKRRFAAGELKGPFPVEVQPLDSAAETGIISSLCKELNDSYCLALPAVPNLNRGSVSLCQDFEVKRLVVIGSSHAGKLSTLLMASLETQFLKLTLQS